MISQQDESLLAKGAKLKSTYEDPKSSELIGIETIGHWWYKLAK